MNPVRTLRSVRPCIKIKELPLLKLEDLTKIEGMVLVESFFKQVKEVARNYLPREQIQICLSRLSQDLRLFVESKINKCEMVTVDMIKEIIIQEFQVPRKVSDVLERFMNEEQYTLNYDPRVFVQNFKVRYSIIEQVFRHKGIPTYSKLLKRVIT